MLKNVRTPRAFRTGPTLLSAGLKNGASACSILTDTPYFGGALTDLAVARTLTDIPLLRKDFIISEFQIAEAAGHGEIGRAHV